MKKAVYSKAAGDVFKASVHIIDYDQHEILRILNKKAAGFLDKHEHVKGFVHRLIKISLPKAIKVANWKPFSKKLCDVIRKEFGNYVEVQKIAMEEKDGLRITVDISRLHYNEIIAEVKKQIEKNKNRNIPLAVNPMLDVFNEYLPDASKDELLVKCVKAGEEGICRIIEEFVDGYVKLSGIGIEKISGASEEPENVF